MICSCKYGWAPPTCASAMPILPICNPALPNVTWPNCQFCIPGAAPYPAPGNGCFNFGTCSVKPLSSINATAAAFSPPGTEFPICTCPPGWLAPMCAITLYQYFGKDSVYSIKFFYMCVFIVVLALSLFLQYQHLLPPESGERTKFQVRQMIGLGMVSISLLFIILYWAMNTFGVLLGGYNYAWMFFQDLLLFW